MGILFDELTLVPRYFDILLPFWRFQSYIFQSYQITNLGRCLSSDSQGVKICDLTNLLGFRAQFSQCSLATFSYPEHALYGM